MDWLFFLGDDIKLLYHLMSASLTNFLATAGLPCAGLAQNKAAAQAGQCLMNVDGSCIYGGTKVAGVQGLNLASLGNPNATCATAGLFVSNQIKYSLDGWQVAKTALPFLTAPQYL